MDDRLPRLGEARAVEEAAVAAVDADECSASAVDSAAVLRILERQRIGGLLCRHRLPDVARREELLPQSESAKPDSPSSAPVRRR
jgi:hypothetical protein